MHRRLFAASLGVMAWSAPGWAAAQDTGAASPPGYTVPEALLQQSVAQRFPLRYPVPGLLNLDVQVPNLRLLPSQNRLGANMDVIAAGPAL
ncbi:MAG TPA: DUF1439 domain-containing protein, partial [Hydrogenophaga sp.]|nr:DUF1439 domain-containing protein [Hydrogenophaga sp.]